MAYDPITAIVDAGKTIINKVWGDKASEADLLKMSQEFELEARRLSNDETSSFYQFVIDYVGAAKDYKDIPFFGPLMLLVRGTVRPALTYATGYWDWIYFTSQVDWSSEKVALLAKINIIVLVFWFGDRIVNSSGIGTLIEKVFSKSK